MHFCSIYLADSVLQDMIGANRINEDVLYEVIDWYTRAVQMTEDNGVSTSVMIYTIPVRCADMISLHSSSLNILQCYLL